MILSSLVATSLLVVATPPPVQSGGAQGAGQTTSTRSTPFPGMPLRCLTPARQRELGGGTSQPQTDCSVSSTTILPLYDPGELWCIPVVVHVLRHNNGSTGNIPMSRVQSQIDILNEDFQAIAGSLGEPGTNATIQFYLADTAPDGSATNGVTYSNNTTWYNDSGSYWNSLNSVPVRYLNIYTNQASGALGYVPYLPQTGPEGSASDRVVILHSAFGLNAPIGPPYNKGRTATHEVGHYLGLYHTFDGGCGCGGSEVGDKYCQNTANSTGSPAEIFDTLSSPGIGILTTWNFQAWYRDTAAGGALFNTSDALTVTFTP